MFNSETERADWWQKQYCELMEKTTNSKIELCAWSEVVKLCESLGLSVKQPTLSSVLNFIKYLSAQTKEVYIILVSNEYISDQYLICRYSLDECKKFLSIHYGVDPKSFKQTSSTSWEITLGENVWSIFLDS
jgi:hypothetical protein